MNCVSLMADLSILLIFKTVSTRNSPSTAYAMHTVSFIQTDTLYNSLTNQLATPCTERGWIKLKYTKQVAD